MCTRYCMTSTHDALRAFCRTMRGHDYPARYNIAPTQPVAIVRSGADHQRELALVRWGLIPGWVKNPNDFATLLNARSETLLEKASFKAAMRHRRCLIPADAYYEWVGKPGAKRPFMFSRADAGGLFAMAGLWEHWMGADGSEIETMAILTVAANRTISTIHDRMPAILPEAAFDMWLDVRNVRDREAHQYLAPTPEDFFKCEELLPAINNSRREGADLQTRAHHKSKPTAPGTLL